MISLNKKSGFVVIVAASIAAFGAITAAIITGVFQYRSSQNQYLSLESENIVTATNKSNKDVEFYAKAGQDIVLSSHGNVLPADSSYRVQIPTTSLKLVERLERKIGGFFRFKDENNHTLEVVCPEIELSENITYTAIDFGQQVKCNVSRTPG